MIPLTKEWRETPPNAPPRTMITITDDNRCYWKAGDIVKFGHGAFPEDTWKSWFMKDEDIVQAKMLHKMNCRNIRSPKYTHEQFAIIIERYKVINYKYKWMHKFTDYGSVIMMLTGKYIGKTRRYFVTRPWERIENYPYSKGLKYIEPLLGGVKVKKDRNKFIKELVEKLST